MSEYMLLTLGERVLLLGSIICWNRSGRVGSSKSDWWYLYEYSSGGVADVFGGSWVTNNE
jgi:hypothetical protein